VKILKTLKTAVALVALCGLAGVAQAQEKKVKDQAEYDLFNAAMQEKDAAKKITALIAWKDKYPESDYKTDRLQVMIATYQQLNQADKMYTTAQELQKVDPTSVPALYYLMMLPPAMNVTTPQRLTEAEQSSAALVAALPGLKKPDNLPQDQFDAQRRTFERQAVKTNVWVATQRKDMAKVEQIYTDLLKKDPNDGESSYELGKAILATKNKDRQVEALYHIGRAAYYDGPNALDANTRKQVQAFFEKTVTAFTGSKEDVQAVANQTKGSAFPPAGFTIKSQQQKMAEQEEKMKADDPQKYLWFSVKRELIGDNGAAYFESSIKGSGLPKLKGKLVSAMPANKPKEITIAIMDDSTPEIKLVVDKPYNGAPPAGTVLEFETAVPTAFSSDPFLVTADIEQAQITGWPAEMLGAPGGVKKAAPKKGVVGKKK